MSKRQSCSQQIFTLAVEATSGHRAHIYHLAAGLREAAFITSLLTIPNKIILTCGMVGDKNKSSR